MHPFRRMSATFSANNGASSLELMQKHNWANPKMALEYIANSRPHRENMASKIQGIPIKKDENSTPVGVEPPAPPIMPESSNLPSTSSSSEVSLIEPPSKRTKTGSDDLSLVKSTDNDLSAVKATELNSNVDMSNWFANLKDCKIEIKIQK